MERAGPPYSPEFRAEAVLMLRSGMTVDEVSRELGVSQQTLRRWRLQAGHEREDAAIPPVKEPAPAARAPDPPPAPERPRRRFPGGSRGMGRPAQVLARLAADVIDVSVVVVTAPAKWTANGLRWYAGRRDGPPTDAEGSVTD